MDFLTLPKHQVLENRVSFTLRTDYRGEVIGVQVKRGTECTDYERTNRRASQIFDDARGEFHHFFSSSRAFAAVMKNKRILDIGCGGGAMVSDLRSLELDVTGIDLYLSDSCKRQKAFVSGDAFDLPFNAQSFDCITSIFSVFRYEETPKMERLIHEAFRVLRPGGRIILSALNDLEKISVIHSICSKSGATIFQCTESEALQIIKRP